MPVVVEIRRGGGVRTERRAVAPGTRVRELVRSLGVAPEGCAVLIDAVSVPLDTPLTDPVTLVVVPTFSGG
ncbi:MAG TPA: MoaD/ThiS family protein [Thermoplasmata archaeon]|nr:MoaD/ThiS family protein [Thermoplasmata archaeon]